MSGSGIGFIDPHERLFRKDRTKGRPTSAYRWDMVTDRQDMENIPDQWAPYKQELFHIDDEVFRGGHYDHTLFRFPLRPHKHDSELCDTEYTPEKLENIFSSLRIEGHLHLLFLRHVESIELYKKTSNSSKAELVYSARISPSCHSAVQEKRRDLLDKMTAKADCSLTYKLELEVWNNGEENKYEYLVCQHCASTGPDDLPQHLPLVGAALPIHDDTPNAPNTSSGGHIFCFLPLPLEKTSPTGLAVHINGYFGVEQNRRHIKWPTAEQTTITDVTLRWNLHLLTDLIPSALHALAHFAAINVFQREITAEQVCTESSFAHF